MEFEHRQFFHFQYLHKSQSYDVDVTQTLIGKTEIQSSEIVNLGHDVQVFGLK